MLRRPFTFIASGTALFLCFVACTGAPLVRGPLDSGFTDAGSSDAGQPFACDAGLEDCGGSCVAMSSDPLNCGACGHACATNGVCDEGSCVCSPNDQLCGDECVALNDEHHCGACDHDCGSSARCGEGECFACSEGSAVCNHACVDLQSDVANCGSCGNTCPGDPTQAACNTGTCDLGWWRLGEHTHSTHAVLAYDIERDAVILFSGAISEWANGTWGPRHIGPDLDDSGMVYDQARKVTVICGESPDATGSFDLMETWLWDGTELRRLMPAHSPRARNFPLISYDSARGVVVLFGGERYANMGGDVTYLTDTWEWDGTDWTERIPEWDGYSSDYPVTAPGGYGSAMVYDTARHVSLFYAFHETWEWDGNMWIQRWPATSPSVIAYHAMAWDSTREVAVLFGGLSPGATGDWDTTWEWDGNNWRQRAVTTAPPGRSQYIGMTYDTARKTSIMFGGVGAGGFWLYDMWEWNGAEH